MDFLIPENIGEIWHKTASDLNTSFAEISRQVGCTEANMSLIKKGEHLPSLSLYNKVTSFLISVSENKKESVEKGLDY